MIPPTLYYDQERIHVPTPKFGAIWEPIRHLPYYVSESFDEMPMRKIRDVVASYHKYIKASKDAGRDGREKSNIKAWAIPDPVGILLHSTCSGRKSLIGVDGGIVQYYNDLAR